MALFLQGGAEKGRPPTLQRHTLFQRQQSDGSAEAPATQAHQVRLLRLHLQASARLGQVQEAVLQGRGERLSIAAWPPPQAGKSRGQYGFPFGHSWHEQTPPSFLITILQPGELKVFARKGRKRQEGKLSSSFKRGSERKAS